MLLRALNAASVLFACAYVTTLAVERPRVEFILATTATTTSSFALELNTRALGTHVLNTGIPYLVAYAGIAYAGDVLPEFCISYATSSLILLWILVAHREQLVLYQPDRAVFVFTRGALYAVLRAALVFARRRWVWLTVARSHIALLLIPTVETCFMWTCKDASYKYDHSNTFAWSYALLKTALFLVVPALDEALYP
jgi:hypothetical protein